MVISSVNNSQNVKTKNKGALASNMAYLGIATATSLPSISLITEMKKASQISQKDAVELFRSANKSLNETGLASNGYKIRQFKEVPLDIKSIKSFDDFKNYMKGVCKYNKTEQNSLKSFVDMFKKVPLLNKFSKNPKIAPVVEQYIQSKASGFINQVKMGMNAFCSPETKMIITPNKSLRTSVFHEMGHALNNSNKLLKIAQKSRSIAQFVLPLVVLATALSNKRKTTDPQSQNDSKKQKFKDFVKRNAGKLTLLSFLPMVAEEGIASLRGSKLAKQHVINGNLSQNVFKKIKITNAYGFASYVLAAVGSALAMKVAVNVKDKVQAKHEQKIAQKMQNN